MTSRDCLSRYGNAKAIFEAEYGQPADIVNVYVKKIMELPVTGVNPRKGKEIYKQLRHNVQSLDTPVRHAHKRPEKRVHQIPRAAHSWWLRLVRGWSSLARKSFSVTKRQRGKFDTTCKFKQKTQVPEPYIGMWRDHWRTKGRRHGRERRRALCWWIREFYIPHKPVVWATVESIKLRIVYDTSARAFDGAPLLNVCTLARPLKTNFGAFSSQGISTLWLFLVISRKCSFKWELKKLNLMQGVSNGIHL